MGLLPLPLPPPPNRRPLRRLVILNSAQNLRSCLCPCCCFFALAVASLPLLLLLCPCCCFFALAVASEIGPGFSLGVSWLSWKGVLTPGTCSFISPHLRNCVNSPRSHPNLFSPIPTTTYAHKISENSWHSSYAPTHIIK